MYLNFLNIYIKNVLNVYRKCAMCMKKVEMKTYILQKNNVNHVFEKYELVQNNIPAVYEKCTMRMKNIDTCP